MAKKKKNVDFQKVKLKVGKHLKKGTNIVDLSFKAKKVILKEQLKTKEPDHLTHRKLSLKELFARLRHYSTAVRHDALMGMKEVFTDHPETVLPSLSAVIEKVAEMILDKDHIVRKAALKALEAAFKCLESHQIMPFFPILKSYLNCAATHILIDVQDDSLPLLDLLIKHFPALATSNCSKVLESQLERLAHRPTKMLTMQSRALLLRVNNFLTAARDVYNSECHAREATSPIFKYGDFENVPYVLLKTYRINPHDNNFHLHQISDVSSNDSILKSEESVISFMNAVHPLLVEVLTEIKSSNLFHPSGISKDFSITIELIENTLNVVNLLEECARICDLRTRSKNALELFHSRFNFKTLLKFMSEFPFKFNQTKYSKLNELSCVNLNLLMSRVFITVFPEINSETEEYYNNIVEYVAEIISNDDVSGVQLTEQTLNILTKLSKTNITLALSEKLLQPLYAIHKKRQVGRKDHNIVMKYITSVALSLDHNVFKDSPTFAYWLSSLPLELVEIANKTPSFLSFHIREETLLALRGLSPYLQGLQKSSLAIIGMLLTVTEKMPNESDLLFQIVELISLIPELSVESFFALLSIVQKSFVPEGPILHLVDLLHERFISRNDPGYDSEAFIGFLLSILLGVLKQDINPLYLKLCQDTEISAMKKVVPSSMTAFSVIPSDHLIWQRHMKLVERLSNIILLYNKDFDNLASSIKDYLGRGMQFPCLQMHTAASILVLQCKLMKKYPLDNGFRSMLVELAYSLLLHSVAILRVVPDSESQVESALKIVCQFLSDADASVIVCDIMLSRLKVLSEDQLATLCSAWCFLLNISLMDAEQMLLVHGAFQNIEFQSPAIATKMWWKELNYLFTAKTHLLNNAP